MILLGTMILSSQPPLGCVVLFLQSNLLLLHSH
jgi:hypothetical protein